MFSKFNGLKKLVNKLKGKESNTSTLNRDDTLFTDVKGWITEALRHNKNLAEEHTRNLDALYSGLNGDTKQRLDIILERQKKCAQPDVTSYDELFSEGNDKKEWRAVLEFEQQILPCADYFMYKNYKLPIHHFAPEVFLYKHGLELIKNKEAISQGAIIDVGGYIADSVLIFREFTQGPIYSFEPEPANFQNALKTIKLNEENLGSTQNIIIENIALGAKNEQSYITTPIYNGSSIGAASNISCEHSNQGTEISVRTLDSYVSEHNISVSMIKVDVEGFEQDFLFGAKQTISSQKPILLLSIYHNYDDFYKIKPLIESWNLGYKFDFFQGIDRWIKNDIMLICEVY